MASDYSIPSWITQDYFENIVADAVDDFLMITKFSPKSGSAAGENYASIMLRIDFEVKLKDGSNREFSLMVKTAQDGENAQMIADMGIFDKEIEVYEKLLPAFEELYSSKGINVTFGPKSYKLSKQPPTDTIVMEDLKQREFVNANRLEGLDTDHVESVLKLIAKFHAASAVYYEINGPYHERFNNGVFDPAKREEFTHIYAPMLDVMSNAFSKNIEAKYTEKMFKDADTMLDRNFECARIKDEDFNVLNHGDSWCNNFMFSYSDQGERKDTLLVDFQLVKYGSPAHDLLYFLLSSVQNDIRLTKFDYFIKFYHDELSRNLTILNYPKKIPSLSDIHMSILKNRGWASHTVMGPLPVALLDPVKDANFDNFLGNNDAGIAFKLKLYSSPRFVKALKDILPWLDNRGMLD
ncbi:hypothetical protein ACFFRR_000788 [Megaselia abdita]